MLQWLFSKPILVANGKWIVRWDGDSWRDEGQWLAYETKSGKRSFSTSHCPTLLDCKDIPGYGEMVAWQHGGQLPRWMEEVKQ